jgi:NAD(P)-dependent dehydrogenase (short-subunit alcohol dehydrogenase family)
LQTGVRQRVRVVSFQDRHVIVTGGTGVLGTAVVGALLEAGAHCHIPYMHPSHAQGFPHAAHPRAHLVGDIDLTDEALVGRLYDAVPRLWASIHIAGGYLWGPVSETDKAALMDQIELNLVTCFLCCRAAVRAMIAGKSGGRIVNVASRPGLEWRTGAKSAAYAATKAAVAALTIALAEEVAKNDILVNAVAPSIIDTPTNRKDMPRADFSAWPKAEEIAQTILFLASPDNKVTRGAVTPVYGRA